MWHAHYMNRFKQYGDEQFMILEDIYADGRDSVVTLLDLDAMGARLAGYVGRRQPATRVQRFWSVVVEHSWPRSSPFFSLVVVAGNRAPAPRRRRLHRRDCRQPVHDRSPVGCPLLFPGKTHCLGILIEN